VRGSNSIVCCWLALLLASCHRPQAPLPAQQGPSRPLLRAAWQGDVEQLRRLLGQGAVDEKDADEKTALHWAATLGRTEAAALLLDRGADASARSRHDVTPVHLASLRGQAGICGLLARRGARVDAADVTGLTPLHWAADEKVVAVLVEHGAKVDAVDAHGLTPLHLARNKRVARALLARGAHLTARAQSGRTPWEMQVWDSLEPFGVALTLTQPAVRLRGEEGSADLLLRHVGTGALEGITLRASSKAAQVALWPDRLTRLLPGQLAVIRIKVTRRAGVASGEQQLVLGVSVGGVSRGSVTLDLDTTKTETPADRGEIRLGPAAQARPAPSPLRYLIYAGPPVILLVLWLVLRRRRR